MAPHLIYLLPPKGPPRNPRPPHAAGLNSGCESGFGVTPGGPCALESGGWFPCPVVAVWTAIPGPAGIGVAGGGPTGDEGAAATEEDEGIASSYEGAAGTARGGGASEGGGGRAEDWAGGAIGREDGRPVSVGSGAVANGEPTGAGTPGPGIVSPTPGTETEIVPFSALPRIISTCASSASGRIST
jgi:hypothetical protein